MKNKKEAVEETCLVESASHYNFLGIGVWRVVSVRNPVIRSGSAPLENNFMEVLLRE